MNRGVLKRVLAVAAIVALIVASRWLPIADWLAGAETWVTARPVLGALSYIVLTAVSAVLMLPGWVPMALAGLLFGLVPGIVYGTVAITCGATAAMLTGRSVARPWVAARIASNPKLAALDEAVEKQAFIVVFLTRVSFVLPFNLLNYAYGLTRVGLGTYVAGTTLGMLPVVGLYVYLGTLADDIGAVLSGDAKPAGGWWIAAVGLAVIVLMIFVVRRTVKRVLDRKLDSAANADSQHGDAGER